jgi:hypothetical protein
LTWIQIFATLAATVLVPLLFLGWLAFTRRGNILFRAALAVLTGAFLVLVWRTGPWHWIGGWWPYVFFILFAVALARQRHGFSGLSWFPPREVVALANTVVVLVLAVFMVMQTPAVLLAGRLPGQQASIELQFPLHDGTYRIIHGGANAALNHHFSVPAQRYALDIVALDGWGMRARGLLPEDLRRYAVFSRQVIAPCTGEVLETVDGIPDNQPPAVNPEHLAGNFVTLACGSHTVLLAHLRRGSVRVAPGQSVEVGAVLGEVGNSGNSTEPHLHIHAVAGRVMDQSTLTDDGVAVPMRFDGRFLMRNDSVRN